MCIAFEFGKKCQIIPEREVGRVTPILHQEILRNYVSNCCQYSRTAEKRSSRKLDFQRWGFSETSVLVEEGPGLLYPGPRKRR